MTIEELNDMILLVNTLDQVLDDFDDVCGHSDKEAEKILTDIRSKYKIERTCLNYDKKGINQNSF